MKSPLFILIFIFLLSATSFAQKNGDTLNGTIKVKQPKEKKDSSFSSKVFKDYSSSSTIFIVVEQSAEFPGGEEARTRFINSNIKYSEKISGIVYVTFIINENGEVKNAKVSRGINDIADAEALRIINMMPKWIPAKQAGKPVAQQFTMPIKFGMK